MTGNSGGNDKFSPYRFSTHVKIPNVSLKSIFWLKFRFWSKIKFWPNILIFGFFDRNLVFKLKYGFLAKIRLWVSE